MCRDLPSPLTNLKCHGELWRKVELGRFNKEEIMVVVVVVGGGGSHIL